MSDTNGWSVSYRQRWWKRRLYACGNVTRKEAEDLALLMRRTGYRRIRLDHS